ncbi:hypothetical protein DTO166G4_7395 [Paecilomyces variotii]|nr:hypothetical protein DTO032I3_6609 [Paecilomyces variotii]KAJ9204236.1 hypothetical protein DTO164E3_1998 [Paecilomyces variotii]KAJ9211003.1 hypothetical protein DTO166G4_7395 [Paecilomyces variotii]KAJ9228966.1 hypothetical protein DTO166G5_8203 [Paecilomyces variotii]KAJ9236050.1 hypothetical protein DTO169E5_5873 [Paecilomyces variotii]
MRSMSSPSNHPNPGNFANRPREQLSEIGRKGGSKGGKATGVGGFHNMDPEKQHAIASKGGRASRGSFEKGSERAREAGRKGGRARGGSASSSTSSTSYGEEFTI